MQRNIKLDKLRMLNLLDINNSFNIKRNKMYESCIYDQIHQIHKNSRGLKCDNYFSESKGEKRKKRIEKEKIMTLKY